MKSILRGDIFYIKQEHQVTGSEQIANRPGIIVSNDECNRSSSVVDVVYLTTQTKSRLPTHVDICSARKPSIALCEHVYGVSTKRLGSYISYLSKKEQKNINKALKIAFTLDNTNTDMEDTTMNTQITINTANQTPIEIALQIDNEGKTTAKKLYSFLGLAKSQFSR